jgi:hypothetical protein
MDNSVTPFAYSRDATPARFTQSETISLWNSQVNKRSFVPIQGIWSLRK